MNPRTEHDDHAAALRSQIARLDRIRRLQSGPNARRTDDTLDRLRADLALTTLDADSADPYESHAYTVDGWSQGIAWRYAGRETAPDADTDWSGIEPQTGRALMVMVGDDQRHAVDPGDVQRTDDYCAECGQIGCTGDGRSRDD